MLDGARHPSDGGTHGMDSWVFDTSNARMSAESQTGTRARPQGFFRRLIAGRPTEETRGLALELMGLTLILGAFVTQAAVLTVDSQQKAARAQQDLNASTEATLGVLSTMAEALKTDPLAARKKLLETAMLDAAKARSESAQAGMKRTMNAVDPNTTSLVDLVVFVLGYVLVIWGKRLVWAHKVAAAVETSVQKSSRSQRRTRYCRHRRRL